MTNTFHVTGGGFVAHVSDSGFTATALHVQYAIPRAEIESYLFRRGYDLRGCEWEFVPTDLTPLDYAPDTADLPLGRVVRGDGWRASLKYTDAGMEVIYIDCTCPADEAVRALSAQGVTVAPDCIVWKLPNRQPPSQSPAEDCEAHRRAFFGILKARRQVFRLAGLDEARMKRHYYKRFSAESMSALTAEQWAVAAAEVRCMADDVFILHQRSFEIRAQQGDTDHLTLVK